MSTPSALTAQPMTGIVDQAQPHIGGYRSAAQALRGIRSRNGRTAATTKAVRGWEDRQAECVRALLGIGCEKVVGVLVEEEGLAERVRIARCSRQVRPELTERLAEARGFLRAWAK